MKRKINCLQKFVCALACVAVLTAPAAAKVEGDKNRHRRGGIADRKIFHQRIAHQKRL